MGLSDNVVTVQSLLSPSQFLTYVQAARPLIDVGAGDRHGYDTHRVQWVMIGSHFELQVRGVTIKQLYESFASAGSFVTTQEGYGKDTLGTDESNFFRFLWDDLLDRVFLAEPFVHNATSPEFLMTYKNRQFPSLIGWQ